MAPAPGQAGRRMPRQTQQGAGRATAAASGGGSGAAGGGRGARHEQQLAAPPPHIKDAREALVLCRSRASSDKGLQQVQALAQRHPGGAMQLYLAKAELVRGVQQAIQCTDEEEGEAALRAAAHRALARATDAAVQHRSLPGLTHAVMLLEQLRALPGVEARQEQRQRLLDALPHDRALWSLDTFAPVEGELFKEKVPAERWEVEYGPVRGEELVQKRAADFQKIVVQWPDPKLTQLVAALRSGDTLVLGSDEQLAYICSPLHYRLIAVGKYLPETDRKLLQAWAAQWETRVQAAPQPRVAAAPPSEDKRQRVAALVAAQQRSSTLASYLKQQLPGSSGGGEGGEDEAQVQALLRLARMPLSELRQRAAAAMQPAPAASSAAGAAEAPAAAADPNEFEQLIAQLVEGGGAPVTYQLPPEAGGVTTTSYDECLRLLQAAVGDPAGLAEARAQVAGAAPALGALLQELVGDAELQAACELQESESAAAADDPLWHNLPPSALSMSTAGMLPDEDIFQALQVLEWPPPWHDAVQQVAPRMAGRGLGPDMICLGPPFLEPLMKHLEQAEIGPVHKMLEGALEDLQLMAASGTVQSEREVLALPLHLLLEKLHKRALLGQQLIELLLPPLAGGQGPAGRGGQGGLGSAPDTDSDGSDAEAYFTPRTSGSDAASSSGGGAGRRGSEGAAPAHLPPAEQLVQLQQVAEGLAFSSFEGALQRCTALGEAQVQQAIKVVGASRDLARVAQRVLSPLDEAATLAAALVRLSRPLPTYSSVSRSDGSRVWSLDQGSNLGDCMQVAGELRDAVLERVLAALRCLRASKRMPAELVPTLDKCLQGAGQRPDISERLGLLPAAARQWEPWHLLGVLPLDELLALYGALCLLCADAFPAGPADLGPQFQEAIAAALAGVQVQPGAASKHGIGGLAGPQVALTRLGLARAAVEAAASKPLRPPGGGTLQEYVRSAVCRSVGQPDPQLLLPQELPAAAACIDSLAGSAAGVPAAAAATHGQPTFRCSLPQAPGGAGAEAAGALLVQLRHLRIWQALALRTYHSLLEAQELAASAAQRLAAEVQAFHQLNPASAARVRQRLADGPDQQGLLLEAAAFCRIFTRAWLLPHEACTVLAGYHESQAKLSFFQGLGQQLADPSALKGHLRHTLAVLTEQARDRASDCNKEISGANKLAGSLHRALQGKARVSGSSVALTHRLRVAELRVRIEGLQDCAAQLEEMHAVLADSDDGAAVMDRRSELHKLLHHTKSMRYSELLEALLKSTGRELDCSCNRARSLLGILRSRYCVRPAAAALAQQLVQRALPARWQELMQPALAERAAAKAAEEARRQAEERQRQAEKRRLDKEREAAAAALVAQEKQEAAKKAKQKQKDEERQRREAEHKAAAAAKAAAARRKADDEAAAKQSADKAAAAAAEQQAQQEAAERRRREQQEVEEQWRKQAAELQAAQEEERQQQEQEEQGRLWAEAQQRRRPQQAEPTQQQSEQQQAAPQPQRQRATAKGEPAPGAAPVPTPAPADKPQRGTGGRQQTGAAAAAQAQAQAQASAAASPRGGAQAPTFNLDAELEALQQLPLGPDGEVDISRLHLEGGGGGGSSSGAGGSSSGAGRRMVVGGPAQPPRREGRQPRDAGGDIATAGSSGGAAAAPPPGERPPARFVSWLGAWVCECGRAHPQLNDVCKCGVEPCRRWFFGEKCTPHDPRLPCRLAHLRFALPDRPTNADQAAAKGRGVRLCPKPRPDAVYKPPARQPAPRQRAAAPAKPAGAAQQPAAASHAEGAPAQSVWEKRRAAAEAAAAAEAEAPRVAAAAAGTPAAAPSAAAAAEVAAAAASPRKPAERGPASGEPPAWGAPQTMQQQQQHQEQQLWGPPGAGPEPVRGWAASERSPPPAGAGAAAAAAAEDDDLEDLLGSLGIGSSEAEVAPAGALPAEGLASLGGWSLGEPPAAGEQAAGGAPAGWGPTPGESALDEDEAYQAAIQASLADAAASTASRRTAAWEQLPPPAQHAQAGAAAGNELALPGLQNEVGEYNCFLNVIVQCLWRCAEFRAQVAGWDAAFVGADPVLAALQTLFGQFEAQEAQRQRGGGGLAPVDPAPLREALAQLPGQQFGLGEMNDAAEVLLSIYEKIMEEEQAAGQPGQLAATFGLDVKEELSCGACGRTTHQTQYVQYFHNTQATMLQWLAQDQPSASMGRLLLEADAQLYKSCDEDIGGCGRLGPVNHLLGSQPRVFSLQLAWESHGEAPETIAAALAAVDETVDLGEVYQGTERGLIYRLRSMVCYYGQHYQALVLVPDAGGWLMFDDTRVTRVGTWADVRAKCQAGRIQPSLLFYEAAAASKR